MNVKMNAEVLIKARKVYVNEPIVEYSETCTYCASKGLDYKLRYYYISLEEAIYKCANPQCLFPFKEFIFKSLVDNSVYRYEEVIDGGREAYLRIPLDGQELYQSQSPLSTKEFCDSQRNPDIESYDWDFSELFNDFESEPQTGTQTDPKLQTEANPEPVPKAPSVNLDVLEFLDGCDITTSKADDQTTDKLLTDNGTDNLINNLLNESPMKSKSPMKTKSPAKLNSPIKSETASTSKAKLSKCIQMIESAKTIKVRKQREKPAETFTMAIKKVRKSQTKSKAELPSVKPEPVLSNKPKGQPAERSPLKSLFKATKNLRPTELAKELTSMKLSKFGINSNFLREYMKAKEDKIFEGEPSSSTASAAASDTNNEVEKSLKVVEIPTTLQPNVPETKDRSSQIVSDVTKTANVKSEPSANVVKNPDGKQNKKDVVKRVRKPIARKPKIMDKDAAVTKKEPEQNSLMEDQLLMQLPSTSNSLVKIKEEKPTPKRKPVSKKKNIDPKPTDVQSPTEIEPKKPKARKPKAKETQQKELLGATDELAPTEAAETVKPAVKRQRKRKSDTEKSNEGSEKPKPKRVRTKKAKIVDSSETQPASSSQVFVPHTEVQNTLKSELMCTSIGDSESQDASINEESITKDPLGVAETSVAISEIDSEGSSEPLFGFTPTAESDSKTTQNMVLNKLAAKIKKKHDDHSVEKCGLIVENKPNTVPSDSENNSAGSSKYAKKPKQKRDNSNDVTKNTPKPRMKSALKSNVQMDSSQYDAFTKAGVSSFFDSGENVLNVDSVCSDKKLKHDDFDDFDDEVPSFIAENISDKEINNTGGYYQRKRFDKEKGDNFVLEKIIDDWDESASDKTVEFQMPSEGIIQIDSSDLDDVASVITIASGTSECNDTKSDTNAI